MSSTIRPTAQPADNAFKIHFYGLYGAFQDVHGYVLSELLAHVTAYGFTLCVGVKQPRLCSSPCLCRFISRCIASQVAGQ